MNTERENIASENGMSIEFVNWFFDNKKAGCGNVLSMRMAAMWEGWKPQNENLTESERYGRQAEITIENLERKVEQLAAENAALKVVCEDRRTFIMNGVQLGYIKVPTVESDPALETIRIAVSPQEPTPATDAILAEVRASGVEIAIAQAFRDGVPVNRMQFIARMTEFAAQLRQEAK